MQTFQRPVSAVVREPARLPLAQPRSQASQATRTGSKTLVKLEEASNRWSQIVWLGGVLRACEAWRRSVWSDRESGARPGFADQAVRQNEGRLRGQAIRSLFASAEAHVSSHSSTGFRPSPMALDQQIAVSLIRPRAVQPGHLVPDFRALRIVEQHSSAETQPPGR